MYRAPALTRLPYRLTGATPADRATYDADEAER